VQKEKEGKWLRMRIEALSFCKQLALLQYGNTGSAFAQLLQRLM
jgi:hypothetical protein